MSNMTTNAYTSAVQLKQNLQKSFPEDSIKLAYGEVTLTVSPDAYLQACERLHTEYGFESLIDLCAVDYSSYREDTQDAYVGARFAVVLHLLSIQNNCRLRVKVYLADDSHPVIASLGEVWPSVLWYEREAFDLFGVIFDGNPDLRRILTDYGFIGHPLRKDFPVSGFVEMRYDEVLKRVVYQPITIEPRENTPRIIRESGYAGR